MKKAAPAPSASASAARPQASQTFSRRKKRAAKKAAAPDAAISRHDQSSGPVAENGVDVSADERARKLVVTSENIAPLQTEMLSEMKGEPPVARGDRCVIQM